MYNLDRSLVRNILISELDYEPRKADFYLDHFPALHEKLAEALDVWLKDRTVLDLAIEGITIQQVMKNHDTNFLNAVRSLNDLLTRPLNVEEREALITFLRNPLSRA